MIEMQLHAENNQLLPEVVAAFPTSGKYLPGKIFIDGSGNVKIVVAVAEDGALTLTTIGTGA